MAVESIGNKVEHIVSEVTTSLLINKYMTFETSSRLIACQGLLKSVLYNHIAKRDGEIADLKEENARLNGRTNFYCPCGSGGISKEGQEENTKLKKKLGKAMEALEICSQCGLVNSRSYMVCPAIEKYQKAFGIKCKVKHGFQNLPYEDENHPLNPPEFTEPTEPYPEEES